MTKTTKNMKGGKGRGARASNGRRVNDDPLGDQKASTPNSSLAVNTTGAVFLLDGFVPGTAIDQRLGRTVTLDCLEALIQDQVTSGTGVDQYHRILFVYDKQPNGAAFVITDVLDTTNTVSFPNLANRARFDILYDDLHHLNASAEPGSERTYSIRIPLNRRVIFNAGTAGTVADIVTGSLYILVLGNVAAGSTAGTLDIMARLFFHNSL
jgi:hypothetical protein